jgi:hypothetical protein
MNATQDQWATTHTHGPTWWCDQYTRAWERARSSFERDELAEPALRFGFGAASYYAEHRTWDQRLEAKLKDDWAETGSEHDWISVKRLVRRGWQHARQVKP